MTTTITDGTVVSADGTVIRTSSVGDGDPLVIVPGPFERRDFGPLADRADAFADRFRVTYYDRRGRNGGAPATSVRQEIDDLAAVVAAARDESGGREVAAVGVWTGAALLLEAIAAGVPVARAVAYEPPYRAAADPDADAILAPARLDELLASGRRSTVLRAYLRDIQGVGSRYVVLLSLSPRIWRGLVGSAPTLPNEVRIANGGVIPVRTLEAVGAPVLVVHGGRSPDWVKLASRATVESIPGASHTVLQDQSRVPDGRALAALSVPFLAATAPLR
jgi:alpha-beta hydrolase superfamily lysophospholipase